MHPMKYYRKAYFDTPQQKKWARHKYESAKVPLLYDSSLRQHIMNSQWLKPSAEACCSSVSGPSHNSGGLSSAAVCASRYNGPFRWRAHQHIHRLIPSIVAIAQDSSFIQTQLSWKGEKGKMKGDGR